MKASFFRNVSNYEMLCKNTVYYKGIVAEYCLIATIYLGKKDFSEFCNDFQKSYNYLMPYIDKAVIMHGRWRCISVSNGENTVLVVMDHYQYPRYLAVNLEEKANSVYIFQ